MTHAFDLETQDLDFMVAVCIKLPFKLASSVEYEDYPDHPWILHDDLSIYSYTRRPGGGFNYLTKVFWPSSDWAIGGPIFEQNAEYIINAINHWRQDHRDLVATFDNNCLHWLMRALVYHNLGYAIDVEKYKNETLAPA